MTPKGVSVSEESETIRDLIKALREAQLCLDLEISKHERIQNIAADLAEALERFENSTECCQYYNGHDGKVWIECDRHAAKTRALKAYEKLTEGV